LEVNDDDFTNNVPALTRVDVTDRKEKRFSLRYDNNHRQRGSKRKLEWSLPDKGAKISSEEFMTSLQNGRFNNHVDSRPLHISASESFDSTSSSANTHRMSTPIFVLNLPKSGTESSRDYFTCGGYESSHTYVGNSRIGSCMFDNYWKDHSLTSVTVAKKSVTIQGTAIEESLARGVPPLQGCNTLIKKFYIPKTDPRYGKNVTVQVFSDIGTPNPSCYYPTLHNGGLDYLYRHYPNATWVLFVRNEKNWYNSMKRWFNGSLLQQWKTSCGFPGKANPTAVDWTNFYTRHTERVRNFVSAHSSLNYIEVELENAHETLGKYTGIESKCWRHCLPGKDDDEKCVKISEKHPEKKAGTKAQKKANAAGVLSDTNDIDYSPPLPWSLPSVPAVRKNASEFMNELAELKRHKGITLPWKEVQSNYASRLKLPTPIFILNLPKSGTQTLTEFFKCGQVESSHTYVRLTRTGDCLRDNYLADAAGESSRSDQASGVDPLFGCDEITKKYHVPTNHPLFNKNVSVLTYSDVGVPYPGQCFYSSINDGGLDHLYKYYPNATIMLLTREVNSWYASASKWNNGRILKAWRFRCGFHGGLDDGSKEDWVNFYHAHTEKIRNFAKKHLSMTYVEMELEDASLIDYYTGVPAKCFQHCLPGKKHHEMCKPLGSLNASESEISQDEYSEDRGKSVSEDEEGAVKTTIGVIKKNKVQIDNSPPLPWSLPEVPAVQKTSKEFMEEVAELKRKQNIPLPWESTNADSDELKLPTPIFILNLPKSGTQTLTEFFKCGQVESSHTYVRLTRTGDCLRDNYLADLASSTSDGVSGVNPLHGCDEIEKIYHIPKSHPDFGKNVSVLTYSDIGTPFPGRCFYSSINDGGLDHLHKYYPNATIMLLTREVNSWYESASKWNDGRILKKWTNRCGFHGSIGDGSKEDWIDFYRAHTEKVRNFAKEHLTMTYIEMELEDASMIRYYTGVPAKCFQHCIPGKKAGEACKPIESSN
jgi:hypothetical protein